MSEYAPSFAVGTMFLTKSGYPAWVVKEKNIKTHTKDIFFETAYYSPNGNIRTRKKTKWISVMRGVNRLKDEELRCINE